MEAKNNMSNYKFYFYLRNYTYIFRKFSTCRPYAVWLANATKKKWGVIFLSQNFGPGYLVPFKFDQKKTLNYSSKKCFWKKDNKIQ